MGRRDVDHEIDAGLVCPRGDGVGQLAGHRGEVGRLPLGAGLVRLQAREPEQAVREVRQPPGLGQGEVDEPAFVVVCALRPASSRSACSAVSGVPISCAASATKRRSDVTVSSTRAAIPLKDLPRRPTSSPRRRVRGR